MSTGLDELAPNATRLQNELTELATFSEPGEPGWSRRVFSEPYRAEREWIRRRMTDAGLDVSVDAAGNLVGRLVGTASGPPLVTGSHTDTVRGGGRFDGIVGVLGAIEVARRLRETGNRLRHDLLVLDFLGEEPNEFGISCVGSRAVAGVLTGSHLHRANAQGKQLGAALEGFGADPERSLRLGWPRESIHAYVELHIEQGPLLEQRGVPLGVVTAIAGIERLLATFTGRADHAGTTPMADRHDALLAAAQAALTVERTGCGAGIHAVSTTGRIESLPGAMNVVPNRARIWAELRSVDTEWLTATKRPLAEQIAREAAARGVDTAVEWLSEQLPVRASATVQDHIARAIEELGHRWVAVPSGAGHDAAHMAHLGPMGMIFVPSRGGRSHVPEEWTDLEQIVTGVHALAAALVRLDTAEMELVQP
jgi:beta-ureidopropionase / N-carbamoyl-L-amino-acid hydrolase